MPIDHLESISESFARFFALVEDREKFADLTVKCGNQSWRVHSVFVRRAPHFATILDAGLREATSGEIAIDANETPVECVEALLKFLYTDKLELDANFAMEMLSLAHRLELPDLQQHVAQLITESFDFKDQSTVVHTLVVAHKLGMNGLFRTMLHTLINDFDRKSILSTVTELRDDKSTISKEVADKIRLELSKKAIFLN